MVGRAANVTPIRPGLSFGKRSDAISTGCAPDPLAFYAAFPDRWMAFLRGHFRCHTEVAVVFSISERAAEKWWNGVGGPQGAKLAFAVTHVPGAVDVLFPSLRVAA